MGKRIKMKSIFSKLVKMPRSFYDALTFGELEIGDKFIRLPVPGDNAGNGGFRIWYNAAIKISYNCKDNAISLSYTIGQGALQSLEKELSVIRIKG